MVDYSGAVVDTFNMTKGLYEAYSKARTDEQARQQSAYQADQRKQLGDRVENGSITPSETLGYMIRANALPQAADIMKLSPQMRLWQQDPMNRGSAKQMGINNVFSNQHGIYQR